MKQKVYKSTSYSRWTRCTIKSKNDSRRDDISENVKVESNLFILNTNIFNCVYKY